MDKQSDMFGEIESPYRPSLPGEGPGMLYRRTDPETSREAAHNVFKSLPEQESFVLEALKKFAPCTARELSNQSFLDYHLIQRRVSGLERKELIKRNGVKDKMTVWEVVK